MTLTTNKTADAKTSCTCCSHFASKSASTSASKLWLRRNSSEGVSQLLAPDLSQGSTTCTTVDGNDDKRTIYSTKNIKHKPKTHQSHSKYCYCSDKPIRPKLCLKPRDLDEERPKYRHRLEGEWTKWDTHGVKRVPKTYDEQMYERDRFSGQNDVGGDLDYTEKRQEYEVLRSGSQNEGFEEIYNRNGNDQKFNENNGQRVNEDGFLNRGNENGGVFNVNGNGAVNHTNVNGFVNQGNGAVYSMNGNGSMNHLHDNGAAYNTNNNGDRHYNTNGEGRSRKSSQEDAGRSYHNKNFCHKSSCKCTFSDIDKESGIEEKTTSDKIRELSKFRDSNFFETHSIKTNSASCAPDHKCVHKFRINDRFLPEPVHCDDFGVSRCTICNKPMEQMSSAHTAPSSYSTRRKKSKHNNVKKIYEYNLIPPRLNIGTGKEVVEISVPQKIERDCLGESHNFNVAKRLAPVNSFALRFQKGVI